MNDIYYGLDCLLGGSPKIIFYALNKGKEIPSPSKNCLLKFDIIYERKGFFDTSDRRKTNLALIYLRNEKVKFFMKMVRC